MGLAAAHDRPGCVSLGDQALHQAALADARLALDQQHRRLPGPDIAHHAPDQLQLQVPSYQTVCQRHSHNRNVPPAHLAQGLPGRPKPRTG
jgi:hypothetical protein